MEVSEKKISEAIQAINGIKTRILSNPDHVVTQTVNAKDEVLSRYQPIFSVDHAPEITEEEFLSFLLMSNNRHWTGLHRLGTRIVEDMDELRKALHVLLDETKPLKDRLDYVLPRSGTRIKNFGRAIITAILTVAYPDKYGVLNNTTEGAMKRIGIWPEFERGENFSSKYIQINNILNTVAEGTELDLWSLDSILWELDPPLEENEEKVDEVEYEDSPLVGATRFGLERHLHDFLRDNWEMVKELSDWTLYEEDGEVVGYEYPTSVGYIDLLGRHKTEDKWLIIELKREQSSDQTVGQIQRYMGWVQDHLASPEAEILGLIISHTAHQKLDYALRFSKNVSYLLYEVKFELKAPKK